MCETITVGRWRRRQMLRVSSIVFLTCWMWCATAVWSAFRFPYDFTGCVTRKAGYRGELLRAVTYSFVCSSHGFLHSSVFASYYNDRSRFPTRVVIARSSTVERERERAQQLPTGECIFRVWQLWHFSTFVSSMHKTCLAQLTST